MSRGLLMNKKIETKIIWILFVLLILIGLNGCAKTVSMNTTEEPKVDKEIPTLMKMDAIANALGCMFAPGSCTQEVEKIDEE